MDPQRWGQIERLYHLAREREAGEREKFLAEACGRDEPLRREVESLLARPADGQDFLEVPALEVAAIALAKNAVKVPPIDLTGRTIAHYRVLEKIGEGGMGEVFLADDSSLHRKVALKFLPPEMQQDVVAHKRFIREAHSAAALDHPYICSIHEVGQSEGKDFIVMEYVDGQTLKDRLSKGPLPLKEATQIAVEVAEALEAAHGKVIIHRDIKPANIMITKAGHAKVMDFGLSKQLIPPGGIDRQEATITALTREGSTLGTLAYMSPEQLRGEMVDVRSDIFSFGVVLYETLAGVHPFMKNTGMDTASAILTSPPQPLDKLRPGIPGSLKRIVIRALAKDPKSRYSSAQEMRKDLRDLQESLQISLSGGLSLSSLLSVVRRPLVAISTLIILFAIGSLGFWFFNRQTNIRRARNEQLPKIKQLIEAGGYRNGVEAYSLAVTAERYVPNDPQLVAAFKEVSIKVSIMTDPPGAMIYIKEYPDPQREWRYLGISPIENLRMPYAFLRLKIDKDGYESVLGASTTWDWDSKNNKVIPGQILRKLDKKGDIPTGMVRIKGEEVGKIGKIDDFFMDQFEVTNRQYKQFVEKGGYQKKEYWKNKFVKEGKELTWEHAMTEFVDRTGRPGPAVWQAGDYPEGQEDFPVSGVSWYEAAAYAEYAGKNLPTSHHWEMARGGYTQLFKDSGISEFFFPQSNFKGRAPERVGTNPAITPYGIHDMGGNVREWCWNESTQGRIIRGGAWNDAYYVFGKENQIPAFDRSPKNGIRCAFYTHPDLIPKSAFALVEPKPFPDIYKLTPVTDAVFRIYKEQFAYDKRDLNSRVEGHDESARDWIKEKVSFDAAYDNERVLAYLFLPSNSQPPYQTLIYWGGTDSIEVRSSQDLEAQYYFYGLFAPLIKNGRAVLYPVYKGTYERGSKTTTTILLDDVGSRQFAELFIKQVKDFERSIDYLETRPDIDSKKLAYLGLSWGGNYGAIVPAIEDRLKVSILNVGGVAPDVRPEINEANYVGRVRIPTLMLNGRYDMFFPYELSVKPMFDLLGTPPQQKELKLYDTDHFVPRNEFIKESLRFVDQYLGPVKHK